MIRLHALHRRSAETNALVVLRDTRWEDSRQIIATIEVDLSAVTQLVYTFPDMILSVNDFHNHVEVAIQTHGYDTWQGGESNLLITMALTGRLSNTSYMGFQYSKENVVDHLTTTGITAIPGERRSIEELEGMSWHLKPPEQTSVRVPSRVAVKERLNRSESAYKLRKKNISLMTYVSVKITLNEARILEEEPLNKVRRSNKPKRSRQKSWERWSTLEEPSRKWDYYVKYDAPPDTTPIEEIVATGWGDEFSNDEVTPGKIIVIKERLAQNQQEFLDEYLPQWDEHLAIQKQELESEWENLFAVKRAIDPERQLEISRESGANLIPAEVLYLNNRSTARHRVHEHYSEQRILCVGENQINLRLCNEESYESLRNSGLQHIHLGIFMIRLHALHRRSAGTNALVVLRDTRWEDSRQIIATMEVDLSAGTQLVYTFPDMILSVNDFHNHVEVAIQTHGYDTWQGGESNLLITMALTGRLSNTSYMGFQYSVENVVDHLTTTGITAIPGERRSIEELEGMSWHLKPPEQTSVRVPSRVAVNERLNRSVSLRFERYRQTPQPPRYSVDQHDREVIRNDNLDENEEHFIRICLQTPQEEHISYDVCFCENCLNEARILEEEPLNKVRRSNKPKRLRQRSWERWSTLGEPSGKWDYYVKYSSCFLMICAATCLKFRNFGYGKSLFSSSLER
ncbi:hypothetical protein Tco_0511326 [Tanacetum coccineum]